MPEPIEYRIVQSLQTALRGIATASGYYHTLSALSVKQDPNVDVENLIGDEKLRPFMILELPPDTLTIASAPKGVEITLPFAVHAVHDSDSTVDESWNQVFYRLCADVEQAVMQDITRGGLAVDTLITSREAVSFAGEQVWAKVNGRVKVRRTFGKPNG